MENKRGHMGKTVIFESKDDHDFASKIDYLSSNLPVPRSPKDLAIELEEIYSKL